MNQFVVPQFIDVEDKIFGPITTRQFLILLVAGLVVFLGYRFGDLGTFIIFLVTVGGGSLVFAFVKVKGQDFHYFLLNVFQTIRKPSLRIWRKQFSSSDLNYWRKQMPAVPEVTASRQQAKHQRIRDLSLVVNTGGYYRGDENPN